MNDVSSPPSHIDALEAIQAVFTDINEGRCPIDALTLNSLDHAIDFLSREQATNAIAMARHALTPEPARSKINVPAPSGVDVFTLRRDFERVQARPGNWNMVTEIVAAHFQSVRKKRLPAADLKAEIDRRIQLEDDPLTRQCSVTAPTPVDVLNRSAVGANWECSHIQHYVEGSGPAIGRIHAEVQRKYDCADWS